MTNEAVEYLGALANEDGSVNLYYKPPMPAFFEVLIEGTNFVMRFVGKENEEGVMMYTTTVEELEEAMNMAKRWLDD